tara:strand:- start:219 stop:443 length:225 start_codon:yes stop_codon:yes gene_type:complete
MIPGDLVRFKKYIVTPRNPQDCGAWEFKIGILVDYQKWEKIARILYNGEIVSIRAENVEKAGKKDFERDLNESK